MLRAVFPRLDIRHGRAISAQSQARRSQHSFSNFGSHRTGACENRYTAVFLTEAGRAAVGQRSRSGLKVSKLPSAELSTIDDFRGSFPEERASEIGSEP